LYLFEAAEHGHALSAARVGNDAAAGSHNAKAAHWLRIALDKAARESVFLPEDNSSYRGRQFALASYNLGVLLLSGDGIAKDVAQAITLFHTASDHDCARATDQLARMSHQGIGVAQDDTVALKLYQAAASAGVGSAAFDLAEGYVSGWVGDQSKTMALRWYRRAAALGFPQAWFALGRFYEEASGVTGDDDEALTWYQLAGNSNVAAAQLRLGDVAHRAELRQVRNDQVALRWYILAADQGNVEAEERIGDLYWQGSTDIPRDPVEAVRHFRIAADRGLPSGARMLAIAYADGDGVPADDRQMLMWEHKAAEAGDAVAAGMLGYAIMIGVDGTYDLVEAAIWLTLATQNAHTDDWRGHTAAYAKDVQSRLTPPEREAFHARLARWRATLEGE
jgi:uncharacterized protein